MALAKTEFELKLVGPASDVAAVPGCDFLHQAAAGPGAWGRITSTYFDSADGRLKASGISLRIRDEAGVRTLTAKVSLNEAGPVIRREAERELAAGEHSFSTGVSEIDQIVGSAPSDLEPIARTVTDRWSQLVSERGAIVEVSAEVGRAERFGQTLCASAVAELELELLKGCPSALFSLAAKFIEGSNGRLRLNVASKLDGALRARGAIPIGKSPRLAPSRGATAADLISLAIKPIAIRVIEAAAIVAETHDGEAARQLRVALRRLRALERVFGKAVGGGTLKPLSAKARDYARLVGAARDLDVFIEKSIGIADAPRGLRIAADEKRAKAWNAAGFSISSVEFGVFSLELLRAAVIEPWRVDPEKILSSPASQYTDNALDHRWKKLLTAGASADFGKPATLHPLRIELKKFRYAAQFFRDLYDADRRKAMFAAMSDLQETLGAISDAVVAQKIAEDLSGGAGADAAKAAGFIAGYRVAEASIMAGAAAEKWRAFAALAPFWGKEQPTDGF